MEKYTIVADSVINLYKSKDSVRRSEVLLIGQDYLIDDCLPDMSAEDYDSYRTKVYLAEVPDKPLGWVNYKDFIDAALKSVAPSDSVEETELEQEDMTTDKVSIWLEELEDEEISDSNPLTEEIVETTTFTETVTAQEYRVKLKNKVFSDVTGKSVNNSINSIILITTSPETTNGPITVYHNDLVYTFNRQDLIYLD